MVEWPDVDDRVGCSERVDRVVPKCVGSWKREGLEEARRQRQSKEAARSAVRVSDTTKGIEAKLRRGQW